MVDILFKIGFLKDIYLLEENELLIDNYRSDLDILLVFLFYLKLKLGY